MSDLKKQELESYAAAFEAEIRRRRESLPEKAFAFCGVMLALVSLGILCGFSSAWFLVPVAIVAVLMLLVVFNAVCVRLNLRDAKRELSLIEAGK